MTLGLLRRSARRCAHLRCANPPQSNMPSVCAAVGLIEVITAMSDAIAALER
jgi:hypothetical protein